MILNVVRVILIDLRSGLCGVHRFFLFIKIHTLCLQIKFHRL